MKLKIVGWCRATAGTPRALLPPRRRTKLRALFPVGSQLVIFLPLLRVAEDFVGLVDFLELFFGGLFVFGDVGMVLSREFAEGLANLLVARCTFDAQNPVIIPELYRHSLSRLPAAATRGCVQRPSLIANVILAIAKRSRSRAKLPGLVRFWRHPPPQSQPLPPSPDACFERIVPIRGERLSDSQPLEKLQLKKNEFRDESPRRWEKCGKKFHDLP